MVKLLDGRVLRRHIDHLQPRVMDCEVPAASDLTLDDYLGPDISTDLPLPSSTDHSQSVETETTVPQPAPAAAPEPRYPSRVRCPPDRYDPL